MSARPSADRPNPHVLLCLKALFGPLPIKQPAENLDAFVMWGRRDSVLQPGCKVGFRCSGVVNASYLAVLQYPASADCSPRAFPEDRVNFSFG